MINHQDCTFQTDDKNFGFITVNDKKYFCHFRYAVFPCVVLIFFVIEDSFKEIITISMIFSV